MKKMILLLCITGSLLMLTSCTLAPDTNDDTSQVSDQERAPDTNGDTYQVSEQESEEKEKPKSQQQVQSSSDSLVVLDRGGMNSSSDNGFYYLSTNSEFKLKDGSYAYQMMYMDYASKKEIILCNRPGCNHDTEECPAAFLSSEINIASSLFLHDGFLYLFSHGQDQDGVTTITQQGDTGGLMQEGSAPLTGTPANLYRMKLDGTDRKQVFSFDSSLSVEDIVLAGDKSLYFISKKLSSEQTDNNTSYVTSTERKLIKLDTGSWKSTTVCELNSDWEIEGTYDGKLIISQIIFDKELSEEDLQDAFKDSQTLFSILNPLDGKTDVILKLSNENQNSSAIHDGKLYVSTIGEEKIRQIDLKTKEETTFVETNANQILSVYQDVLLSSGWDSVESDFQDKTMYFIHFDSRKIDKSGLVIPSMGTPIEILGETKDTFLVIYDIDAEKDTQFGNDQYTIQGYKYALIEKDDLYTGKANYQIIEMVGFGE